MVDVAAVKPQSREAAVEALYEHGPMLLAAARVITLDNDEAKDLVQATFGRRRDAQEDAHGAGRPAACAMSGVRSFS